MAEFEDVRSLPALWPFRQRRHLVIVCVDDPAEYVAARPQFAEMNAELLIEESLGRPRALIGRS